uniref:Uncharacterized protein n=1 Tax=Anopheles atroparvus TaxID=41427 RepID=A0A182ILY6_ANOAO
MDRCVLVALEETAVAGAVVVAVLLLLLVVHEPTDLFDLSVPDDARCGLVKATERSLALTCGPPSENGLRRMQRKAEVTQDASSIESSTTMVTVKPGVVMQIRPSSRAENTIVVASPAAAAAAAAAESLWEPPGPMGKVRSPGDTTRMTRFSPTSSFWSAGSVAARVRRIRRSSRFRLEANTCASSDCGAAGPGGGGGGGGGPYCWCSGPPDRWCTSRTPGSRDISFGRVTQPRWSTSWIGARLPSCAMQLRTSMSNLPSSSLIASTIVIVWPILTRPDTSDAHGPLPTWICIQQPTLSPAKSARITSSMSTGNGRKVTDFSYWSCQVQRSLRAWSHTSCTCGSYCSTMMFSKYEPAFVSVPE